MINDNTICLSLIYRLINYSPDLSRTNHQFSGFTFFFLSKDLCKRENKVLRWNGLISFCFKIVCFHIPFFAIYLNYIDIYARNICKQDYEFGKSIYVCSLSTFAHCPE